MINVLGWKLLIAVIALTTVSCGAISYLLESPENLIEFFGLFSKVGFLLSVIILGIGQSPLFALLCKHRPLNWFVPDIDGPWQGDISSNWSTIARECGIKDRDGKDFQDGITDISADICVKLFSISIELRSKSHYQNSKTLSCDIKKNSHRGFELSYIYRSSVPDPKASDDQSFLGAGFIDFTARSPSQIDGVYWTNRKWRDGLNTAGTITLRREIPSQ